MANSNQGHRKHTHRPPAGARGEGAPAQGHAAAGVGRSDSAGDAPLMIVERLTLEQPFRLRPGLVKRLRQREVNTKEAFTVRDGSGAWFRAALQDSSPHGGVALPYERMARSPEPTIDVTLACAVLARQRMILVMQKATELGVMRIVPLLTEYSVPREGLPHENAHAWPGQVTRAVKQCRRGSLPEVMPPTTLDELIRSPVFTEADLRLYLDDRSEPVPAQAEPPRRIVLLVGPEGGFSDAERAKLAAVARPWVLGGRVLRAETAVIVGLTAVQMLWGDLGAKGS